MASRIAPGSADYWVTKNLCGSRSPRASRSCCSAWLWGMSSGGGTTDRPGTRRRAAPPVRDCRRDTDELVLAAWRGATTVEARILQRVRKLGRCFGRRRAGGPPRQPSPTRPDRPRGDLGRHDLPVAVDLGHGVPEGFGQFRKDREFTGPVSGRGKTVARVVSRRQGAICPFLQSIGRGDTRDTTHLIA